MNGTDSNEMYKNLTAFKIISTIPQNFMCNDKGSQIACETEKLNGLKNN